MDSNALRAAAVEHARGGVLGPAVHVGGCRLCGRTVTWIRPTAAAPPASIAVHACEVNAWGRPAAGYAGSVGLVDHLGWLTLTPSELEQCRLTALAAREGR